MPKRKVGTGACPFGKPLGMLPGDPGADCPGVDGGVASCACPDMAGPNAGITAGGTRQFGSASFGPASCRHRKDTPPTLAMIDTLYVVRWPK